MQTSIFQHDCKSGTLGIRPQKSWKLIQNPKNNSLVKLSYSWGSGVIISSI